MYPKFLASNFFGPKICLTQNFFWPKFYIRLDIFWIKNCETKLLWTIKRGKLYNFLDFFVFGKIYWASPPPLPLIGHITLWLQNNSSHRRVCQITFLPHWKSWQPPSSQKVYILNWGVFDFWSWLPAPFFTFSTFGDILFIDNSLKHPFWFRWNVNIAQLNRRLR